MRGALAFSAILEDLPYADNRVTYDAARSRICLTYHIHPEAHRRLRQFRLLTREAFKPLPVKLLRLAHNSWMLGHQVGTCRFGTTAQNSVLDRDCRAHELDNLFIIDGSFMPTSGGINPSLTIAANALRTAAQLS
jgi:choline dehydrogenase-like flavoprotein